MINTRIYPVPIKDFSSKKRKVLFGKSIKVLKRNNFWVKPEPLSGAAPKDLIFVYEYGKCRKYKCTRWTRYIAKVGHQGYPVESIIEQLMTRLGQVWGFKMANSQLFIVAGQLRFCSEIFLRKNHELIHGANILSSFIGEDEDFILQIEKKGWAQELLTFDLVTKAIKSMFPTQYDSIISDLVDMLLFDAIVGNNDRHFYNWGVIRDLKGKTIPCFSPIYDTARGLFWQRSEELIKRESVDSRIKQFVSTYDKKSKPLIGWHKENGINHAKMVECLHVHNYCNFDRTRGLFSDENLQLGVNVINNEFKNLLSNERKKVIIRFLTYRFAQFRKILN